MIKTIFIIQISHLRRNKSNTFKVDRLNKQILIICNARSTLIGDERDSCSQLAAWPSSIGDLSHGEKAWVSDELEWIYYAGHFSV